MKQVFIKKGEVTIEEVPAPAISKDEIMVEVHYSSISAGTEISNIKASGRTLIRKAIEKPQDVRKTINSLRSDGLISTLYRVLNKISEGHATGYSASGLVVDVGQNIRSFKKGDRVACSGYGFANHADFIVVPENLAVKVPEILSLDVASTVAIGSIALHAVRRTNPRIGEMVLVIGLGLVGQFVVQLLKISGCCVLGIDIDQNRIDRAQKNGLDKGFRVRSSYIIEEIIRNTNGYGADSVIITASSEDNTLINQAIKMTRKKGKIVIVGDVNMSIDRDEFYEKELDLLISTSYGPGRYDDRYEKKGIDYPYAYIRWTENRNMKLYLELVSKSKIDVNTLIDATIPVENSPKAYEMLKADNKKALLVVLEYKKNKIIKKKSVLPDYRILHGKINVGIIGAGGFIKGVHLPNLKKINDIFKIHAICSKTGSNAASLAVQYGAKYSTTDYKLLLGDKDLDFIIIGTRHDLHALIAQEVINSGKALLLEKPMATQEEDFRNFIKILENKKIPFVVGFNRRFSPLIENIKFFTDKRLNPMIINYRVNAGLLPNDSWVHSEEGGGRNIGEACHIYDLFGFFTNSKAELISTLSIKPATEQYRCDDNFVVNIRYNDGSVCNLVYTSLGIESAPKEQMDIYFDNKIITLIDYKELYFFGIKEKNIIKNIQNKGHFEMLLRFGKYLKNNIKEQLIPLWQLIQVSEISFEVERQLKR